MGTVRLSATAKGNGYQATVIFPGSGAIPGGVAISSAETYPTIAEAISAAALKVLEMPDRLEEMDHAAGEPRQQCSFDHRERRE